MDLTAVTSFRQARTRADAALQDGETYLAGGTWLFSEANRDVGGLVDLTTLGWEPLEVSDGGLTIAATCTIAQLLALPPQQDWRAQGLFAQAADALLASFKIWNEATVGGNIVRAYAAGAMIAAATALDATATVWTADGGERTATIPELIGGNGITTLARGEVLRAVHVPAAALRSRASLQAIALAERGRSGAVATGRTEEGGGTVIVITAATERPVVLRYPAPPSADVLVRDVRAADGYYSDAFGAADWRRQVAGVVAARVLEDLTA